MEHRVLESKSPVVSTIEVTVCGDVNNISIASAIYESLKKLTTSQIDVEIVSEILLKQIKYDKTPKCWYSESVCAQEED